MLPSKARGGMHGQGAQQLPKTSFQEDPCRVAVRCSTQRQVEEVKSILVSRKTEGGKLAAPWPRL